VYERLNHETGQYEPDPDYHPTDLITVRDVYGGTSRVRAAHLVDSCKMLLPRFNQYGSRLVDDGKVGKRYVHRQNLLPPHNWGLAGPQ